MSDAATIKIEGDNKGVKEALEQTNQMLENFASTAKKVGGAIMAYFAIGKIKAWGEELLAMYQESEEAEARLNAVNRASGQAAGFTTDELKKMAAQMQQVTVYTDEAALAAETALLKFGSIKGDNFKETLALAADLAAVTGGDLAGAAQTLGMALEHPERAMRMLRSAGVHFSDEEQKLVKNLKDAGKEAEVQSFILGKLRDKVGGVAEEMANTSSGRMKKAMNALGDVGEKLGEALLPVFNLIIDGIKNVTPFVEEYMVPALQTFISTVMEVGESVYEFIEPSFKYFIEIFNILWEEAEKVGAQLLEFFGWMWTELAQPIYDFIKPALDFLVDAMVVAFTICQTSLENMMLTFKLAGASIAYSVVKAWNTVIWWFKTGFEFISVALQNSWTYVKVVLSNTWDNIKAFWDAITNLFSGNGWTFEWKGLTDGLEKQLKSWPEVVKREIGPVEAELGKEVDRLAEKWGSSFEKNLARNRRALGLDGGLPTKDEKDMTVKEYQEWLNTKEKNQRDKPDDPGKKGGDKAQLEDLVALNKRITQAAAGGSTAEKHLAVAEKQLAAQKENNEEAKQLKKQQEDQATLLASIRDVWREVLPQAGALR